MFDVLIANDDGPMAAGLRHLTAAVSRSGIPYRVSASETEASDLGTGKRDERGARTCAGQVADALEHQLAKLVITGVNDGPNIWPNAIHSGTVGGALVALTYGISAIAISRDNEFCSYFRGTDALTWDAAEVVCDIVVSSSGSRDVLMPYGISINVPAVRFASISGVTLVSGTARGSSVSEAQVLMRGAISVHTIQAPNWLNGGDSLKAARSLCSLINRNLAGRSLWAL